MSDPFDKCVCGHNRRAHDSAGCGKWIETTIEILGEGMYAEPRIVGGHICKCTGFRGRADVKVQVP